MYIYIYSSDVMGKLNNVNPYLKHLVVSALAFFTCFAVLLFNFIKYKHAM